MIKKLRSSEFIRSVATLTTGTLVAQIVAYLVYPIITRFCTESDFGELALYTRFVSFIAAFATARYDFAIPLTKQVNHAFTLFRLSLRIAFVCLFAVLTFGMCYALFQPEPSSYLIFISLSVGSAYATVWISIGTNWAIRKKEFRSISFQKVTNSVGVGSFRLLFVWLGLGGFGLLLGSFIGAIASSFVFVISYFRHRTGKLSATDRKRMKIVAKEYKQFPSVNLPHVLIDLGVDWIVALSVAFYFDKGELGWYSHAFLMMKLPLSLIGQSISQVFFNRASEMVNNNQSLVPLVLKSIGTLFLLSIVPFTIILFFGGDLFAFVFGSNWRVSGEYAQILVPYLFLNFIFSPISSMPLILGRQKEMLGIGILVAIIQLFCFVQLPYLNYSLVSVIWANSLTMSVVMISVGFVYFRFAQIGKKS